MLPQMFALLTCISFCSILNWQLLVHRSSMFQSFFFQFAFTLYTEIAVVATFWYSCQLFEITCGVEHSCIDCLLLIHVIYPRTNKGEKYLTMFTYFSSGIVLRAKVWTVVQCPGHDTKLHAYWVNVLSYRECGIWFDGGKGSGVLISNQWRGCGAPACVFFNPFWVV